MAALFEELCFKRPPLEAFTATPSRAQSSMQSISINPADPISIEAAINTEWLLTNGLGGYAMGTALGVNTRRYHGLLVAATKPPVGRIVALHSMIEQLVIPRGDGTKEVIDLSTQQFVGGDGQPMLHPGGWRFLSAFEQQLNDSVVWIWSFRDFEIRKSVSIGDTPNLIDVNYWCSKDPGRVRLRVRPFLTMRDFHALNANGELNWSSQFGHNETFLEIRADDIQSDLDAWNGQWQIDTQRWDRFSYSLDHLRGQDWIEHVWSPGFIEFTLADMTRGAGFAASAYLRGHSGSAAAPHNVTANEQAQPDQLSRLRNAASQFIVDRRVGADTQKSVIAGYPWFGDWGRDTMIALPGLMLCTGRFDEARSTLLTFARSMKNGLIPNLFDDYGGADHYNTVDASLWFVHAVGELWKATLPPLPLGEGRGEGKLRKGVGEFVLDPELLAFARDLRKSQTDAEELMWGLLRNRRLLGLKFRRQHPVDPYVIDLFCAEKNLAIEIDGGQHNETDTRRKDEQRTAFLNSQGIRVLRFWNHEVLKDTDAVLESIVLALTPGPSPRGRGGVDPSLLSACREIIAAYRRGTDFNIRMDSRDALIAAGDPSTQLTWMDAKRDNIAFTPRNGKPVEINALWFNALRCLAEMTDDAKERDDLVALSEKVAKSFREHFWWGERTCLHDVLAPMGGGGDALRRDESFAGDRRLRPNQIFAVSLPFSPLTRDQQRAVVKIVGERLLTPYGLRTLDRDDPQYRGRYEGNMFDRDSAYHQGTVWPWLIGPYCEALLRVNDFSDDAKRQAAAVIQPLIDEMSNTSGGRCLNQIAEVYDGDPPHHPGGCPAQAWSVAEVLRILTIIEDSAPG